MKTQYENLGDQTIGSILAAKWSGYGTVLCIKDDVPDYYMADFINQVTHFNGKDVRYINSKSALMALLFQIFVGKSVTIALSPGDTRSDRSRGYSFALKLGMKITNKNLRLFQVGTSYTIVGHNNAELLRIANSKGNLVSVRDSTSQQNVIEAGGGTMPIVPDLAFSLPIYAENVGKRAIFQFRSSHSLDQATLVARLKPLVAICQANGLQCGVFWQVSRDEPLTVSLAKNLNIECWNRPGSRPNFSDANNIYQDTAVIFSNRLHGLLIAAASGAIPIAILEPSETKISGVFLQSEMENFISKDYANDIDKLKDALANVNGSKETIRTIFLKNKSAIDQFFIKAANK